MLRELIQNRLDSQFQIHNRFGEKLPNDLIRHEYHAIKQYILDHHVHDNAIAIALTKDYRYFLTILACLEVGVTYIPLKFDYPQDRISQIQEDSGFKLIVHDKNIEKILSYNQNVIKELPAVMPDKNAYIIFTSGSTGRPKGVIIPRKALENFIQFIGDRFQSSSEERLLQVTEFTFDISVSDISFFLTKNTSMYFSNFENNIIKLGYEIDQYRINILVTVPNNLNMFLSDLIAARMDYKCLNKLLIAGSRFSYGLYEKCQKYFDEKTKVFNLYGPTEATVYSHYHELTYKKDFDCHELNVSIGLPLPNMESVIVTDGKEVKAHEKGELYIGGVQLMSEYINNPEQTKNAILTFNDKRFYKSGDLAYQCDKGNYYIVGRTDDTIKYRGFRINLLDIDSYITRLDYVQDSVTIAVPHDTFENQTICFLILKEDKSVKEIKSDLSLLLLEYQIPEKIIFQSSYPTNVSGKVCRKTLKENYLKGFIK